MEILCHKCRKEIKKLHNIYGTVCPYCKAVIKPIEKPSVLTEEKEMEIEILKQDMLNKLRKKIKGEENAN